jgi:hypothetical protein
MGATGRTLHVDHRATPGPGRARSREDALRQLVRDEYDEIVLHNRSAGHDDSGLVEYLAATWPDYLRTVTVVSVSAGARYVWCSASARFQREAVVERRRDHAADDRRVQTRGHLTGRRRYEDVAITSAPESPA